MPDSYVDPDDPLNSLLEEVSANPEIAQWKVRFAADGLWGSVPITVETRLWDDGTFATTAFHTFHPADGERPFYRLELSYRYLDDSVSVRHRVSKHDETEDASGVVDSEVLEEVGRYA